MKIQVIHDGSEYNPDCYYRIYTHGGRLMAELFSRLTGDYMGARFIYDLDDTEEYVRANDGPAGYRNMCWDLRWSTDAFMPDNGWHQTAKGTLIQ